MRLLVTRPEPDATTQAERLRRQGQEGVIAPVMRVEFPEAVPLPLQDAQALVATSRNGLRALARNPALAAAQRLPLFAVGPATAHMGRALAVARVHESAGGVAALAGLIAGTCKPEAGALVHLAGERLAGGLKRLLEEQGFEVRQPRLYRTVPVRALPRAAREAIAGGALDGVILMSPATAETFAALAKAEGLAERMRELHCFCLSDAVAAGLAPLGAARVHVAERPDEDALLALIAREAAH